MYLSQVVLFLACATIAFSARSYVERIERPYVPSGWTQGDFPSPRKLLPFTLVLKIQNASRFDKKFWSVSDPTSPDYANYLTLDEIAQQYGPSEEQLTRLTDFLKSYGVTKVDITRSRDFVSFEAPVEIAEKIFEVKFREFTHATQPTIVRTLDPYTLPTKVADLVSFSTGFHRFPTKHKLSVKFTGKPKKVIAPRFGDITPQVIWSTFNTSGQKGTNANNLQGVAQFLDQFFDPSDLTDFQSHYSLPKQSAAAIVGPNDATNPGTEASLDIQYITGTAPLIPTWFWSTGPPLHEGQEDFVRWAQNMNSAATVPYVISVSYGDDESSIDKGWADRLNLEFQKLAVRGISVLFASGDDGVGCSDSCHHLPNWPASSPFVTSVGGFVGTSGNTLIGDGISSGGFSNFYQMPSYQQVAVKNYLATGPSLPPSGQYNATSRAMPDVSSFSENVVVFQGGFPFPVGGTSCAAPVFAGVVALINDALLNAGKKTVGFLNPALYQIQAQTPAAFIDITSGHNANGCCSGFTATKGWDPITGLGAPYFPTLKQAFLSLQK